MAWSGWSECKSYTARYTIFLWVLWGLWDSPAALMALAGFVVRGFVTQNCNFREILWGFWLFLRVLNPFLSPKNPLGCRIFSSLTRVTLNPNKRDQFGNDLCSSWLPKVPPSACSNGRQAQLNRETRVNRTSMVSSEKCIYCHTPAQKPPYLFVSTPKGEKVFAASTRIPSPSTTTCPQTRPGNPPGLSLSPRSVPCHSSF